MDLEILLVLSIWVFIWFFIQTIAWFAASFFSIPILLYILTFQESVALMSIFFLIFSIFLFWKNWRFMDKKILIDIWIPMFFWFLLGNYILATWHSEILAKLLWIFSILYVLYSQISKKQIKVFNKLGIIFWFAWWLVSWIWFPWGILFIIYINNKIHKWKDIIRATMIWILAIWNFIRVPLLLQNNILSYDIFIKALYIFPIFLISVYIWHKAYGKINEKAFNKILMVLLVVAGITLIFR